MKSLKFSIVFALAATLFTSCTKAKVHYACICTPDGTNEVVEHIYSAKREKAQRQCDNVKKRGGYTYCVMVADNE